MRRTKTEKGITLVALIITIVVLLILAVVAISAIQNDGILSHAQNATGTYNNAVTNEQTMLNKYETYLNDLENGGLLSDLVTYILGADKTGRLLTEVFDWENMEFIDDTTTKANEATTVEFLNMASNADATKDIVYVKYNYVAYKVVVNVTTDMTESVSEIYKKQGREGEKVQYDGDNDGTKEDWYIITDRNNKVEIVSVNLMGSTLALGSGDTNVTVTEDLDGDGKIGDDGDIAIASYNNAITTINNYCNEVVTATDNGGVRSVGGTNNSASPYSSPNFNSLFDGTGEVASGDMQFEEDFVKLAYHKILRSNGSYWFASRYAESNEFVVRYCLDNNCCYDALWFLKSDGTMRYGTLDNGVRPVVINPNGI